MEEYKDDFMAYEKVRQEGHYNMITEAAYAAAEAGLTMDRYFFIIKNYIELKKRFK